MRAVLLLLAPLAAAQTTEQDDFFESKVRPLLANNCYGCHGPAARSGLRLDSRLGLLKGGSRGPAIAPGKPEESLLLKAVSHTHETLRMPPPGRLSEEDIANLTRWVKEGAVWPESPAEFFTNTVRPILATNCLPCHAENPQGALRMDTRANLLKGGTSGPALVPGDPDKSLLVQAIRHQHAKMKMPPSGQMPENDVTVIVEWVKSGAVWPDGLNVSTGASEYVITPEQKSFWSFQSPKKRGVPAVRNKALVRTPVDNFILTTLESRGLRQAAPADRRTLIRRVAYDLTGLPPTPEAVEDFVKDKSPDAFARLVDRLLESPHYGERWGRHWLDAIRYADSAGDSADYPIPQIRLYRDYVIDAFNKDKPFDQFIREQIAGDLLPAESEDQRWNQIVATGYLANTRRFGVSPERFMQLTHDDSIDNLGKVFLGLSVSCARCHDHKYDPISARDYYALYGVLDSTRYPFAGSENKQEQADLVARLGKEELAKLMKPLEPELAPIDAKIQSLQAELKLVFARQQAIGAGKPAPPGPEPRNPNLIRREVKEWTNRRTAVMVKLPPLEMAYAVAEGEPHDARVMIRGERDSLLTISGQLDAKMGGIHPFPPPDTWKFTQHKPFAAMYESKQRSVYLMTQRIQRHPFLAMFDGADTNASTAARTVSITPLQALFMINSELSHQSADHLAGRLMEQFTDSTQRIDHGHRLVLGRPVAPEEMKKAKDHVVQAQVKLAQAGVPEEQHGRKSLASYLLALLSSNEFIFVD